MHILKPVLMLAILSSVMVCNNAWAIEPSPRVGATRIDAGASPAPAVPKKKPAQKRRAVRQILDDTPAPARSTPHPSPIAPVGVQALPSPVAPPPQILNGCPDGACTDATGARYHGGVGTTLLSPQGRVCSNNGITVQCF